MTIELLAPNKEDVERMLEGCKHYNLTAKHTRTTDPYVHVTVISEQDVVNIFWLGMALGSPKVDTGLSRSAF